MVLMVLDFGPTNTILHDHFNLLKQLWVETVSSRQFGAANVDCHRVSYKYICSPPFTTLYPLISTDHQTFTSQNHSSKLQIHSYPARPMRSVRFAASLPLSLPSSSIPLLTLRRLLSAQRCAFRSEWPSLCSSSVQSLACLAPQSWHSIAGGKGSSWPGRPWGAW